MTPSHHAYSILAAAVEARRAQLSELADTGRITVHTAAAERDLLDLLVRDAVAYVTPANLVRALVVALLDMAPELVSDPARLVAIREVLLAHATEESRR